LFPPAGNALTESLDIAKWADLHSNRAGAELLFPDDLLEHILRFNKNCDLVLSYGRQQFSAWLLENPAKAVKLLPRPLQMFGPLSKWLAVSAVGSFRTKYKDTADEATLEKVKAALDEVRSSLGSHGGQFILGRLTYADLAMAVATTAVRSFGPSLVPGQAGQGAPGLEGYQDLVEWRNSVLSLPALQNSIRQS
jgi:glutathione S-transferase